MTGRQTPAPAPPVQLLGEAVLLRDTAILHALSAVASARRNGQLRNGKAPHPTIVEIEAALTTAARCLSPATAGGRVDVRHTSDDTQWSSDPIDATTAAGILGCTRRNVYRIAPSLGGRRHAGHWMFDRANVTAYTLENQRSTTSGR